MEATQHQQTVNKVQSDSEVNDLNAGIIEDTKLLSTMFKAFLQKVKQLTKQMEKQKRRLAKQRPKRKVKQKPQKVTAEMQKFMKKHSSKELEIEHGDSYTRQIMMKSVSHYIKTHKLQNTKNMKEWSGNDKTLKKLFKLDKEWYTFMQINGLLSRIVVKA